MDYSVARHPEFRYKTEFQSHEPEVYIFIFFPFYLLGCDIILYIFNIFFVGSNVSIAFAYSPVSV